MSETTAPPFRSSTVNAARALVSQRGFDWAIERTERDIALHSGPGGDSVIVGLAGDRLDCLRWLRRQEAAESPQDEPEVVRDPEAFQKGRARALEAVLARLDRLPEDLLTKTRDEGRGVSHARDLVRPFVERLLADPTWSPNIREDA